MGLSDAFLARLDADGREAADASPGLEAALARLVEAARRERPALRLDEAGFVGHVASLLGGEHEPLSALGQLRAGDLALAFTALTDADAAEEICALVEPPVRGALRQLHCAADEIDERLQALREKLLVGTATRPPALAAYAGRAKLVRWARVVATRDAHDARQRRKVDGELVDDMDALIDGAIEVDDPELVELKRAYRVHFKEAFQIAFAALSPRERNVLRHQWLDGLSIDRIGALYGVHRATVARWRAGAREALFVATRRLMQERLDLSADAYASMMRLIQSQLEVSLPRLLAED